MRALIWATMLMGGLWSGYWFVGKTSVERVVQAFFQEAPAQGLIAENSGISILGFPSRFDLTVTSPRLADPRSGVEWQAPFLQVFSLSYKPWHIIAAFPPEQTLSTAGQDVTITSEKLQASVVVTPNTALTLDRATLVGSGIALRSSFGWQAMADELRFALRQDPSRSNTHEIGLDLNRLQPDPAFLALLPQMPTRVEKLHLDAFVGFDAPIDRFAGQTRPRPEFLEIKEAGLNWGDLSFFAKGRLDLVDATPEGRLDLRIENWRDMMPFLAVSGAIKPEVLPTVETMLTTLAQQSGDPEVLDLPLIFAGGQMRLGPLPLGPAPRLSDQRQ